MQNIISRDIENQYSVSTTRTRAHAREADPRQIYEYYCRSFGASVCPPIIREDIDAALDAGLDAPLMKHIIDETMRAPRPTWRYAAAIIRRCIRQNIHNRLEYEAGQYRFYGEQRYNQKNGLNI